MNFFEKNEDDIIKSKLIQIFRSFVRPRRHHDGALFSAMCTAGCPQDIS
jgi:hypothetical protein